jgi:hypothetical protein
MSKYDKFSPRSRIEKRPWDIHPVWQGIGCVMMILIPIMAYAGAVLLVQENITQKWVPMPPEMLRTVQIPNLTSVDHLYGNLLVAALLAFLGFGLLFAIYSMVYSIVGPPRYGPLDAPPMRYKKKKR